MRTYHERTNRFSGNCGHCVYPVVRELDTPGNIVKVTCPGCKSPVKLERLYGEFSDKNCDPSCQYAFGNICVCGCGGANHRAGWLPPEQTGEVPAHLIEDFQARVAKRQEAAQRAAATRKAKKVAHQDVEAELAHDEVTNLLKTVPADVRDALAERFELTRDLTTDAVITKVRSHDIVADIRRRLWDLGRLSEKQILLVARLVDSERRQVERKAAEDTIAWRPAPEGRVAVSGVVLSTKTQETQFGQVLKMLVKVDTATGAFKVWSTVPEKIQVERGDQVSFKATLKRSDRDEHFAFGSRPSDASVKREVTV
jgi:hypothetical protein